MNCFGDCSEFGPPPDAILSMPPPPLSSFFMAKNALAPTKTGNNSTNCIAAFMCEPSLKANEQAGMEFVDIARNGPNGIDDTWLFVLVSSCVGILLLVALLAMLFMKCRDSYHYSYHDTTTKHPPLADVHMGTTKSHAFIPGTMLYPSNQIQQQMAAENRALWATLTPHGTQHFISDSYCNPEDHYEVIDYGRKHEEYIPAAQQTPARINKNSFENNGFVDYDYEDPTPLMDAYHFDDMDSGYQEPQEVIGTVNRNRTKTIISSPTNIENPNLPPLNSSYTLRNNGTLNSLNKKATLSRRVGDIKN